MSRRWIICVLVLWSLLASLSFRLQAHSAFPLRLAEGAEVSNRQPTPAQVRQEQAVPQKAHDLLARLQARYGEPLPGYIGGREFQNREGRLPQGHYREYDVNPKIRGRSRDAERIVIEQDGGRAYYTGDHYRTFVPMNEVP